jgi:hypothetical protein
MIFLSEELFLIVKIIVAIYFRMNELKYKITNSLKKSDCIEILKDTLTFEELKNLITPNFNQLIHILRCLTKREVQYICFKHEKITIAKITDIIKNKSLQEKNTIDKTFFDNEEEAEEEETFLPIENIEVKKLPAENTQSKKLNEKPILQHNPTQNNTNELTEVSFNIEELPSGEMINLKTGGNPPQPPDYKRNCGTTEETNTDKLNKVYNIKKVREILLNNNFTEDQIVDYLKTNSMKIIERMRENKTYGKHFVGKTATEYKEVYDLMRMVYIKN